MTWIAAAAVIAALLAAGYLALIAYAADHNHRHCAGVDDDWPSS